QRDPPSLGAGPLRQSRAGRSVVVADDQGGKCRFGSGFGHRVTPAKVPGGGTSTAHSRSSCVFLFIQLAAIRAKDTAVGIVRTESCPPPRSFVASRATRPPSGRSGSR